MEKDEQEIRKLVETWMTATKAGDVATVLGLMTDDVVFLVPGRPPMGKAEFAAAARAQSKDAPAFQLDGRSEIQEVRVLGDWAVHVGPASGEHDAGGRRCPERSGPATPCPC